MAPSRTVVIAEAGVVLALATALKATALFRLPQGGSVTAGSLVPLWFFARRYGPGAGMGLGCTFGMLDLMLHPIALHPLQVVLDYPLAFAGSGLAGLTALPFWAACGLAVLFRYSAHVASGIVYFSLGAPTVWAAAAGSAVYNLYAIADGALALIVALGIAKRVPAMKLAPIAGR